jgi:hypothetical protein
MISKKLQSIPILMLSEIAKAAWLAENNGLTAGESREDKMD